MPELILRGVWGSAPAVLWLWVGSCRRELLDHLIVLNESHLRRLVRDYLEYYHDDRIHDALLRGVERRPSGTGKVVGMPGVSGLHHRYHWQTAA